MFPLFFGGWKEAAMKRLVGLILLGVLIKVSGNSLTFRQCVTSYLTTANFAVVRTGRKKMRPL